MTQTTIRFACEKCGKAFNTPSRHAGRSTTCPGCKTTITVPAESTRPDPLADLIGFSCELCGTRIDVPSRYIGRKVKCPDCDKANVVPQPAAPPPKAKPVTLDAYDVYEGEQQPRGIDLARAAPESIHFDCPRCQTHLTAPIDQAGRTITCHDCEAKVRIPQPPARKPAKPASPKRPAAPEEGFEVEKESSPTAPAEDLFAHYTKHTPAGYRERQQRAEQGKTPSGRPKPKGLPVVTDAIGLLRSPAFLSIWLAISGGIAASDGSLLIVASILAMGAGGFGMMAIYCFTAIAVTFGVLSFLGIAAYGQAIFAQSSEGAPKVDEWPLAIATEWLGAATQLFIAVVVTAALGGGITALIGPNVRDAGAVITLTFWLALPWVLLSQIDLGMNFGVFSPRLLRTLSYAPLSWAAFYLLTALGGALWYELGTMLFEKSPYLMLLMAPVTALAALEYAWLLGRLAWTAAEATPDTSLAQHAD